MRNRVTGPPSLRNRLLWLVGVLALALSALAGAALWQALDAARTQFAEQLVTTTRALARVVDQEFIQAEALLRGWALLPAVRAGRLPEYFAVAAGPTLPITAPIIALAGPDNLIHDTTRVIAGRIAPGLPAAPEVATVFATGQTAISDYEAGNDPGRRRIIVAVPVREPPDGGDIRHVIGLVLPQERLSQALREQRLPDAWVAAILDRNAIIVARTVNEAKHRGTRATDMTVQGMAGQADGMLFDRRTLEGEPALVAFATAPLSGYRVVVAAPRAIFDAVRWHALGRLAVLVVPIALLAGGLSLVLARNLAGELRDLAGPGRGGPPLLEAAGLAQALAAERRARDAAEAALREGMAWAEAAQQAAEVGVFEWEVERDTARWSDGLAQLLHLSPGVPASPAFKRLRALVPPADRPGLDGAVAAMLDGAGGDFALEFRLRRPGGGTRWLRAQVRLLSAGNGLGPRVLGAFIDISARRALEAEREALLRQQGFLAGEIHHRVKNSLQLVLSLLLLQARRASPEAAEPLREAAGRVATVAAVHRRLYEDDAAGAGDAARYFAGLVADLRRSLAGPLAERDIRLDAAPGLWPGPERLAPLGIVATELMTNALKYGAGTVTLRLFRGGEDLVLVVEDEGPGFPPGFDPASSTGLGMRVATTMTRQAGGQLQVDHAAGHGRVVLRIPAVPSAAAAAPPTA